MKNLSAFVLVFLFTSFKMFAQDVIHFNNGTQSLANILEVRTNEVVYKMAENPNGPIYTSNKAEISSLLYANGYSEVYGVSNTSNYNNNTVQYQSNNNNYQTHAYCRPVQVVRIIAPPVIFPVRVAFGGHNHFNHHGGGHHHGGHHEHHRW